MRAHVYKRDQYERAVATAYVRRAPLFFLKRDVGLELLKRGLAVTYEGKTGAEFGGAAMEARYRAAEALARKKGRGMWGVQQKHGFFGTGVEAKGKLESPMEYKRRMKALEGGEVGKGSGKA